MLGVVWIPSTTLAAEVLLEDFESPDAITNWEFSNGPEFPGASGNWGLSTGHTGKGARLAYDLTGGGNYVSASLKFTTPVTSELIALWLKQPARSQAKLRLYDSTGQAFEYSIARPLEASDSSRWFRVIVDVNESTGSFGGSGDGIVHQPLTGISVLAIPEFEIVGSPTGSIEFDDVRTVNGLRLTQNLDTLPLLAAPPGAAKLGERLAVNIHDTDARGLDIARAAGFSRIRFDLGWSDIETTRGHYDFSRLDTLLAALSARGMRLHLILNYLNPLYPGFEDPDFMARTLPAFADLSRTAAEHFRGKGVSYEIWNEPNTSRFWSRSVADFARLSASVAAAIRQSDPSAEICTGGVSGFDYRFVRELLAAGGGVDATAIGVHPYRLGGGETVGHDLLLMRAIIEETHGTLLPVWDTEWGYSSTWYGDGHDSAARNRQAQLVVRELLAAWALGFPLAVYYELRDGGLDATNDEHNFGLVQNDYEQKPAMLALERLTDLATDYSYVGLVETGLNRLHALRLQGANDHWYVLWWDDPKRVVTVKLASGTIATDLFGKQLALSTDASAAQLTLTEHMGPVYVSFINQGGNTNGGATAHDSSGVAFGSNSSVTRTVSSGAGLASPNDAKGSSGCTCTSPKSEIPGEWHLLALAAATCLARRYTQARAVSHATRNTTRNASARSKHSHDT